ncbi:MAG: hypothetical protein HOE44_18205, partial [Candidatus Marinimicrobia bacterium]|nr:hypothetical protein [Candidatus Neomarinimicrobiota bacterium]
MNKNILTNYLTKPSVYQNSHEEDFLLNFFFHTNKGVFVDIGGNLPDNAVSRIFWNTNWDGFVVEPLPDHAQLFRDANINVEEFALTSPEKATNGKMSFTIAHIVTPFSVQSPSSLQPPARNRGIAVAQSRWSAAPGSHLP